MRRTCSGRGSKTAVPVRPPGRRAWPSRDSAQTCPGLASASTALQHLGRGVQGSQELRKATSVTPGWTANAIASTGLDDRASGLACVLVGVRSNVARSPPGTQRSSSAAEAGSAAKSIESPSCRGHSRRLRPAAPRGGRSPRRGVAGHDPTNNRLGRLLEQSVELSVAGYARRQLYARDAAVPTGCPVRGPCAYLVYPPLSVQLTSTIARVYSRAPVLLANLAHTASSADIAGGTARSQSHCRRSPPRPALR